MLLDFWLLLGGLASVWLLHMAEGRGWRASDVLLAEGLLAGFATDVGWRIGTLMIVTIVPEDPYGVVIKAITLMVDGFPLLAVGIGVVGGPTFTIFVRLGLSRLRKVGRHVLGNDTGPNPMRRASDRPAVAPSAAGTPLGAPANRKE